MRLNAALAELVIEGVDITVSAIRAVLTHVDFGDVRHHTGWLESGAIDFTEGVAAGRDGRQPQLHVPGVHRSQRHRPRASADIGRRARRRGLAPIAGAVRFLAVSTGNTVAAGDVLAELVAGGV